MARRRMRHDPWRREPAGVVVRQEWRRGGCEVEEGRARIAAKLISGTKAQFRQIAALPISTLKFDVDSRHY